MSAEEQLLWLSILKAKYFPSSSPMFALPRGGSKFWKSLVKVRPVFQSFVNFVVGVGSSIRFWLDWWCGDSPLSVTFPILFSYCSDPNISIAKLASQGWNLAFRRSLSPVEFEDWQRLRARSDVLQLHASKTSQMNLSRTDLAREAGNEKLSDPIVQK